MLIELKITGSEDGKLFGDILKSRGFSRRLVLRMKRTEGGMTRGGETIRTVDAVREGDVIVIRDEDGIHPLRANNELCVPVLYEDSEVVVFDKPAMMPVHPSTKHTDDTLGNYFAVRYPMLTFRPVSRLDRDTTGCVLAAKSQYAAAFLQKGFGKRYLAVCCGVPDEREGIIDAPIARERNSIISRCVREDGKDSVTKYRVISENGKYALCEVMPITGRTHQIRVHFAHIGHPLAGDDLYHGSREDIRRQALHCCEIRFTSPADGLEHTVKSALPKDMEELAAQR